MNGPRTRTLPYGPDPSQWGDLYVPARRAPNAPTVVLLHGGFWWCNFGADLMAPAAADLARCGYVVWNLEFRRVGNGGGWPATPADVARGLNHLATLAARGEPVTPTNVVAIGHSAGAQLAAWSAARRPSCRPDAAQRVAVRPRAVISLAGILDLRGAHKADLGAGAVGLFLGGSPEEIPRRYAAADPVRRLPLSVPVHCVHSVDDAVVPIAQSSAYVDEARRLGAPAELHLVPGGHRSVIDVGAPAWRTTSKVLGSLVDR